MTLRTTVLVALALSAVCATPATAAAPHLGTPEVIASFGGEANLLAAASAQGHPDAYAVFERRIGRNAYTVLHRDTRGHAHRFDIPTTRGTFPQAIRIVALEAGAGMAIWDEDRSQRVLARAWTAAGTLGATQTVLAQVTTTHSAENDSAQWRVRADGRGTVVVASTGRPPAAGSRVVAAVRDPGRPFGPQQELTPPTEPNATSQRQIAISPIAVDGSVAVSWGPEYGAGPGGAAIRSGRAATFGAASARPFAPELALTRTNRTTITADGTPVEVSAALARRCPCIRPQVFRWAGGTRVLAFQTYASQASFELGGWYVARPGAGGVFDHPVRATDHAESLPVRRARPAELGFARFDTNTAYNLFRRRSRLVVVPFGARVPRSRRAPRLAFGTYARATKTRLLIPVFCDRVCGVHGSSGRAGRLPTTDFQGRRIDARLEPFSVGYLRVTLRPGRRSVRISAGASDDAGHRAIARASFQRSTRTGLWCRGSRTVC